MTESRTCRAYSISASDIAREKERVAGNVEEMDIARVMVLGELELRELDSRDVQLKILAVSAEHNIAHAALADTIDIADARGGRIYPGNSAVAEVMRTGPEVTRFKVGDVVLTHAARVWPRSLGACSTTPSCTDGVPPVASG